MSSQEETFMHAYLFHDRSLKISINFTVKREIHLLHHWKELNFEANYKLLLHSSTQ